MQMQKKLNVRQMTYAALSTALIAVCSWVTIPAAVPFTLQTFAVFTVCSLLGGKLGLCAVALYMLLGAGAGMALYLLLAAPALRPLWEFWADVAGELGRLLRIPARALGRCGKKLLPKVKKGFHSARKYAILNTYRWKHGRESADMAKSKKKTVSRSRVAALLVILVLLAAVSLEVARVYGSRLPELRSKSQALDAQIQQTEKQNDVLRSDLDHEGDPDFVQGLARDDLGLASDGERIFYDVNN